MTRLNRGEDYNGRPIDAPTSFFVGVAVNPTADDLELELDRFRQKVEAGAQFAMTQIVFDLDYLDRFVDRLGGAGRSRCSLGVCPLWSYRLALRLHNELPGSSSRSELQDALRDAGADAAEVGMAHAKRAARRGSRPRATGVYVVAPYRQPAARARAADLVPGLEERSSGAGRPVRPAERAQRRRTRSPRAASTRVRAGGRRSRRPSPAREAKTVVSTSPARVDRRAARVAVPDASAQRRHASASTGPSP